MSFSMRHFMQHLVAGFLSLTLLCTCAQKERQPSAEAAAVSENATTGIEAGPETAAPEARPSQPAPGVEAAPRGEPSGGEVVITTDAELRYAIDELIIKGNLSDEQKSALYDLRVELGQGLERNTVQNVKLRSMLVQELLSENGTQQGANMIGNMIHKNIMDRMGLIEDSINKVNGILGFVAEPNRPVRTTNRDFF